MTQVDTFVIKTIDGTAKTVSFTITGVNDVATISTPTPARVTEDIGAADGYLRTGGILTVTDADAGQSTFQMAVTALGSHIGALALASDGTYQYSVANAQVQYLGDGETKVESFTIKSFDGTSKDVSFTIIGVNDGAIIGDPTNSVVIEDTSLFRSNLVASGTISITDSDQGQASFKTTVVPLVNTWGSLTLATDGAYTYSVANNIIALQALNEGQTKVDQFTITSFDGTKKVVDFNIHPKSKNVLVVKFDNGIRAIASINKCFKDFTSRREADRLVQDGRVLVNGELALMGTYAGCYKKSAGEGGDAPSPRLP
jgi:VCBS repeat-containing protein